MDDALKALIADIKDLVDTDEPAALAAAVKLTEQYPDEPDVWRTLAYIYALDENDAGAIAAMTRAIQLAPRKPTFFFYRGWYLLGSGDYEAAIVDFGQGLLLCDELNDDYNRESLHFLRAEAYFQLGRKAEARADLEHVRDDAVSYTIEVRSKAELSALCAEEGIA